MDDFDQLSKLDKLKRLLKVMTDKTCYLENVDELMAYLSLELDDPDPKFAGVDNDDTRKHTLVSSLHTLHTHIRVHTHSKNDINGTSRVSYVK